MKHIKPIHWFMAAFVCYALSFLLHMGRRAPFFTTIDFTYLFWMLISMGLIAAIIVKEHHHG